MRPTIAVAAAVTLLGGCRRTVVWDQAGGTDSFEDAVVAVVLFGLTESDPEWMAQPHVAGGSLTINAAPVAGGGSRDWTATTLAPEIVEVVAISPGNPGITIELQFLRAGTTELYVLDAGGDVLAAQTVRVRDPVDVALLAWDDILLHASEPLASPIRVVGGTTLDLAVSWRDLLGTPLVGGELVTVSAPALPAAATVDSWFTGEVDVIELVVDEGAAPAGFTLEVAAPTATIPRDIEIVARSEADRLEVVPYTAPPSEDEPASGYVGVRVFAGPDRLTGAPVTFDWPGAPRDVPPGTVLAWSADGDAGPTPVSACFDTLCTTFEVDGAPTGVISGTAPKGCGCASGPGPAWLGLAAGALAVGRRRRRSFIDGSR